MQIDLERARGALWGQAVGDALGTTVEFLDERAVATRPATAWPKELIGAGPFRLLPGQVTDDTELALALARTLVSQRRYDDDAVAAAYLAWCASDPVDCGNATAQAFRRPLEGPGLAERVRARAHATTQANGSLMRASPLGLFGANLPRAELAALAARDSTLSHPSPVCQAACAVYVTTIADALTSGLAGPALYDRALAFAKASAPLVVDTLEAAARGLPVSDGENQGWVRLALQHAFFHLRQATDFERALVATVVKGGDADTNGCVTGALLGAALGVAVIPQRWRDTVAACALPRPRVYTCGDLDALSRRLCGDMPMAP